MPLSIPTRASVSRSLETYVRAELPSLDPTPGRRSKVGAWVKSLASGLFDWYVALADYANHEPFPQTARGQFLFNGWWAPLTHLTPLAASPARGTISLLGTVGTTIPANTRLSGNGVTYTVQAASAIVTQPVALTSLTYSAATGLVTAVTASVHLIATGQTVTVALASDVNFNGSFVVTATSETTLTYLPTTPPVGIAGSPTLTATWASVTVTASTVGAVTNIAGGGSLTVTDSIPGVQTTALVTYGGVASGSDAELVESFRTRILKALGTDFGAFTGDEIEILARSVPGVTRVFVRKATLNGTNGVNEGQVKVAFMRDGDANPFPSAQAVADVKAAIVANIMTAHTASEDVIVISPTPHVVNFQFTSITPNTVTMRAAIKASLTQFFAESTTFATSITVDEYRCAIKAAFDATQRQKLTAFTLASPVGDIAIAADEMPRLGTVTFT